jgi:Flp pilus assembly pilin Flp
MASGYPCRAGGTVSEWRSAVPKRESGQAVVEYALVLALVAAGLLIALLLLRSSLGGAYDRMAHRVSPRAPGRSPETGVVSSEQDERGAEAKSPGGAKGH